MLDPVNTSLPVTAAHSSRFDQKPIAVLIAFAALAALALYAVRSLRNRVQPLSSARALYDEGFADFQAGKYQDAINKYSLALKSNPSPLEKFLSLCGRGMSYRALDQLDKALEGFTDALACECEKNELSVEIHIVKGDIHAEQEDHKKAVQEYDSASKLTL
jgi:tetratricopeptide (TPR) repeat protein